MRAGKPTWVVRWGVLAAMFAASAGRESRGDESAGADAATAPVAEAPAELPPDEPAVVVPAAVDGNPSESEQRTPGADGAAEKSAAVAVSAADSAPAEGVDEPGEHDPLPGTPLATRCRIKLTAVGELVATAGRGQPPVRRPIELDARFDFEERPAEAAATVSRTYTDAVASLRIGDDATVTSLAADARSVLVVRRGATAEPYLADGFLTGEELDLLATPFDGVLLDDMLAAHAVAEGETWEIPAAVTAGVLAIDTVESGRIVARLEEVAAGRGRISFSGTVEGAVDGVPTTLEVSGSLVTQARGIEPDGAVPDATEPAADATDSRPSRYDVGRHVRQLSAVIRERRQAGHVAPGFDVEARVVVARSLAGGDLRHAAAATAGERPSRSGGPGAPGRVWYRAADGQFELVHDARWKVIEDGPSGLVMRLVDRGALVGQCSVSASSADAGGSPTIADVRRDIEQSLAGQLARVDDASEQERADGTRIVRVASSGTAERLPFTWIHYVVVAASGRRVNLTFMVQETMRARFAEADRELVAALEVAGQAGRERPDESEAAAVPDGFRQAQAPAGVDR